MNEKSDYLKELIQNGSFEQAIKMIRDAEDYNESSGFAFKVLKEEKSTPELVEAVLEVSLSTRENHSPEHGYWVHAFSHLTGILWERRMDKWIKKFNEVAFRGANELRDANCSNRLVEDFAKYAKWNDDPADFHLTIENLRWMDWEYSEYAKVRIEAGRFESEEAFLRWELRQIKSGIKEYKEIDHDACTYLVTIDKIQSLIQKLREFGSDISEFDTLENNLLANQLSELEGKLSRATRDGQRELIEIGIQKTRVALAALTR